MSLSRILANIGTALDSATTGDFLSKVDSDGVFGGVAYSSVTGTPTVLDSANITNLIDSAYIQLRQSAVASGGLDSATTISFVDSDYITSRATASGFQMFEYDATAGQTEFTGSDVNGNTLAYSEYGLLVHYNGILLSGATDYTATDGTTVVLTDSADADARITIAKWSLASAGGGGAAATWYGDRALTYIGRNNSGTTTNAIDYFDITTTGNASDFGDMLEGKRLGSSFSDGTYAVHAGGLSAGGATLNVIEYVTTATPSNSTDFGDLTVQRYGPGACSNGTRGLAGGGTSPGYVNVIDYVTIATPSNASDFGDLTASIIYPGSSSNSTYGVWAGGTTGTKINTIDYVTIATSNDASDFGDLLAARDQGANGIVSDETYGIFSGGNEASWVNTIEYITFATPGNATDFGDLLDITGLSGSTGNGLTGVVSGGRTTDSYTNVIQYYTIASPGNATDFGDLTTQCRNGSSTSGSPS